MQEGKSYRIEHSLLDSNTILVRNVTGTVRMCDIVDAWKADVESGIVHAGLHAVITNFTEGENLSTMDEMKEIEAYYNANADLFGDFKMAVVLDATNISIAMFFEKEHPEFKHKPFSTPEAALFWARQ